MAAGTITTSTDTSQAHAKKRRNLMKFTASTAATAAMASTKSMSADAADTASTASMAAAADMASISIKMADAVGVSAKAIITALRDNHAF